MVNSVNAASDFAASLRSWGAGLPEDQQAVLQSLMIIAVDRITGLLDETQLDEADPDFELLSAAWDALGQLQEDESGNVILTTPCWTVTTTLTTAQSSRWFCEPKPIPKKPKPHSNR